MSFLFGGGSGGQTPEQKDLTKQQSETAKFGLSEAKKNLPKATDALTAKKGPLNFFQALLSGDRNSILSAIQPQVDSLTSQYDTGRKTAEEFAPRGGGRAAALEELPFRKSAEINKLVGGAQMTGASGVESVASLLGSIGTSEMGGGLNAANSAFQNTQQAKENQQAQAQAAGSAIGGLVALLVGL
jgi:hypothetical protein